MTDRLMLQGGYIPADVEGYSRTLHSGGESYRMGSGARPDASDAYCIVLPPPNVTGFLHMGHALNHTLQDILVRYKRMEGVPTLWQPGTDHAGIATQMVVERQLAEKKIRRTDLGRSAFVDEVWRWKEQSGNTIVEQQKMLGESCDWSRQRFTMDAGLSRAVIQVFVRLHREGLIYRDKRLVNWDPKLQTAVSDLEVEAREMTGSMWMLRYPLADDPSVSIVVGTTRPETMLGDAAVAVHPDDARYKHLVGRMVRLPLCDRLIPIVADEYSDPEKGTGAVKITPAHDFNDFEVGRRHKLPMLSIFDATAHCNDQVPAAYRGLERFKAREKVLADLEALGLLVERKDNLMTVPYGDRSGVVIEPRLTDQWYVDAKTLAQEAIRAVEDGRTEFVPKHWEKTYFEWMHNIQPWCISRQLWWGHRVPAWYAQDGSIFVAETEAEALAQARQKLGPDVQLQQDEDVLDTWFSSALWPFSTLGWPDQTPELKRYYPTSVLVTGFDIIFFWVARMMMMGLKFMGEVPFRTVYIHALVRDEHGDKMSKTKGNVIDPLDMIRAHGADALRFTLASMAAMGRDIRLATSRIEGYQHFGNKIWNAVKFCQMQDGFNQVSGAEPSPVSSADHWIMDRAGAMNAQVVEALGQYRFNDLATSLYNFIWNDFCDWYLEATKVTLREFPDRRSEVLNHLKWVVRGWLKALHPLMPHLTEYIWDRALGLSNLPQTDWRIGPVMANEQQVSYFALAHQLIGKIRSTRTENRFPPAAKVTIHLTTAEAKATAGIAATAPWIRTLAAVAEIHSTPSADKGARDHIAGVDIQIPFAGHVDFAAEKARIAKEIAKLDAEISKIQQKLDNPDFRSRAPAEVIAKSTQDVTEAHNRRQSLIRQAQQLEG